MASLVEVRLPLLDFEDVEENEESGGLKIVVKEELWCLASLALGLIQEDGPREEEPKGFDDPKVFLMIVLEEGKSSILLNPKISLVNSGDEEPSFKLF